MGYGRGGRRAYISSEAGLMWFGELWWWFDGGLGGFCGGLGWFCGGLGCVNGPPKKNKKNLRLCF